MLIITFYNQVWMEITLKFLLMKTFFGQMDWPLTCRAIACSGQKPTMTFWNLFDLMVLEDILGNLLRHWNPSIHFQFLCLKRRFIGLIQTHWIFIPVKNLQVCKYKISFSHCFLHSWEKLVYFAGKNNQVVAKLESQPVGISIIHQLLYPMEKSPCKQLKCSHLCLVQKGTEIVQNF